MSTWNFEYSIDVDEKNRMLYVKVYGVWKAETGQSYHDDIIEAAKVLTDKPWSKIIDLTNWKTAYPEVTDIIGKLNIWCRSNNMEWAVYIINNPVGFPQLMRMFDSGAYRDIGRTFRTRGEGEKFLKEKGYKIKSPNGERLFD